MKYYRISKLIWSFKIIIPYLYNLPLLYIDSSLKFPLNWIFEIVHSNIRDNQSPFFLACDREQNERKSFCISSSNSFPDTTKYTADTCTIKRWPLCFASVEIGYHTLSQINEDLMAGRPWGILDTWEAKFTSSCDDLYSNLTYQPLRLVSSHTLRFIDAYASFEERLRSRLFASK